jgi:hypothetical protein
VVSDLRVHVRATAAEPASRAIARLVDVTIQDFAGVDEPGADPILGTRGQVVLPERGDSMIVGDAGTGKSTLQLDLAFHLAAGDAWLGIPVEKPRRVLLIENEGPRPQLRVKADRKLTGWQGAPIGDRLRIIESPWGRTRFDDEEICAELAELIKLRRFDVVSFGPLMDSGMNEAGTSQQVRAFCAILDQIREAAGGHVSFVPLHHENVSGEISGRWKEAVETVIHLRAHGAGRTNLRFAKARWSSDWHGQSLELMWAPGDAFTIDEQPDRSDEEISNRILDHIQEHPGAGSTALEKAVGGNAARCRQIRDGLFHARLIVNVAKVDGVDRWLFECKPAKAAHLYRIDNPTIQHLRPDSDAVGTQSGRQAGNATASCVQPLKGRRDEDADPAAPTAHTNGLVDDVDEAEVERLIRKYGDLEDGGWQ